MAKNLTLKVPICNFHREKIATGNRATIGFPARFQRNLLPRGLNTEKWKQTFWSLPDDSKDDFLNKTIAYAFRVGGPMLRMRKSEYASLIAHLDLRPAQVPVAFAILFANALRWYRNALKTHNPEHAKNQRRVLQAASRAVMRLQDTLDVIRHTDDHLYTGIERFWSDERKRPFRDMVEGLETLQEHLDKFDWACGQPGRPMDYTTPIFIVMLAKLYVDLKGHWPKRKHDPITGHDYGDFRDFTISAIRMINPRRVTGADDLIRVVLRNTPQKERLGYRKWQGGVALIAFALMGINVRYS